MLALNATIEAVRAGVPAGASVVAAEVKALATKRMRRPADQRAGDGHRFRAAEAIRSSLVSRTMGELAEAAEKSAARSATRAMSPR